MEQKKTGDLTRLELTVDYDHASWKEFQRIFPVVLDNGSSLPPDLTGTDRVLCLACMEHSEYIAELPYKKRKKIEQLLATTAQNIEPDEFSYKNILAQILMFGNQVKPEMFADFVETDEDFPEFVAKNVPDWVSEIIEGEQEQM